MTSSKCQFLHLLSGDKTRSQGWIRAERDDTSWSMRYDFWHMLGEVLFLYSKGLRKNEGLLTRKNMERNSRWRQCFFLIRLGREYTSSITFSCKFSLFKAEIYPDYLRERQIKGKEQGRTFALIICSLKDIIWREIKG